DGVGNSTLASAVAGASARTNFLTRSLSSGLLQSGSNVLAAEIHQAAANGTDIRFEFGLAAVALVPSPATLGILPSPNGVQLAWPADSGLYHLYTTTSLCPGTN